MAHTVKVSPQKESGYGRHSMDVRTHIHDQDIHYTLSVLEWSHSARPTESSFQHPTPVISRLFYFVEGDGHITLDHGTTHLKPNTVYLIPPKPFDVTYHPSVLHFIHLQIQHPFGWDLLQLDEITTINDRALIQHMQHTNTPWSTLLMCLPGALLPLIESRLGTIAHANQLKTDFAALLAWIDTTLPAQWSVEAAAEHLLETRSALSKRFQRKFGFPLKQFFVQQHIVAAQSRLRNRQSSVDQVATELGHNSPQAFQRFFKQHVGQPPRRWARLNTP